MSKAEDARKGLTYNEATGEYNLTYVVNNLMSSMGAGSVGLAWLTGFDERASILREMEVLANLGTITIDGKRSMLHRFISTKGLTLSMTLESPL